jgi:hypothetical protein
MHCTIDETFVPEAYRGSRMIQHDYFNRISAPLIGTAGEGMAVENRQQASISASVLLQAGLRCCFPYRSLD